MKTSVYMGASWCILGACRGKARHLNKSNQSKFGLIQLNLFPNDDMLACIIRVLSVPRRKNDDHKLHDLRLYFADYGPLLNSKHGGPIDRSINVQLNRVFLGKMVFRSNSQRMNPILLHIKTCI